ncbi:Helix-turn-helix domain protein [Aeoliella mucimassa]|uniref:Helix-turn-helix domain protein n=1 Tax=Aeoliella mucimassa TaxID=2527972 RepID=A0A518AN39_9BACT|nr:Helix-turn-helix domain protein [Aeoliella mucimassa]
MSISTTDKLLLRREEAAEMLGIGIRTLDAHAKLGNVRSVAIGRLVRFDREELVRVARSGLPVLNASHRDSSPTSGE